MHAQQHSTVIPGRDKKAVRHAGPEGASKIAESKHVVVVGGGIAGVAAATVLAERGVNVTLCESTDRLGGRVSAWNTEDGRTMSRGFHAFFRQYYNLRALLKRVDPQLSSLMALEDYPLVRPDGRQESFKGLPLAPPRSFIEFVRRSPAFTLRNLMAVNIPTALELLRVDFPGTYSDYDGQSAESFLDRLHFPEGARDLALEVFARSFFAHPSKFGAGELIAMFHTYFLGSAEGLLFDVPDDDYHTTIWQPLHDYLTDLGTTVRTSTSVDRVQILEDGQSALVSIGQEVIAADAVVLATDPRTTRKLVTDFDPDLAGPAKAWSEAVGATNNAPPFTVVRLWFDKLVQTDRAAFLGTSGFGHLDNVSVLERFESGAAQWSSDHDGSVVELHAYACADEIVNDDEARDRLVSELRDELSKVYPETETFSVVHEEVLVYDDCGLIGPNGWKSRPSVETPWPALTLAGDWLRCDYPVALMERATTTGYIAANTLLSQWGVAGQDIWTVPMSGMLRRKKRTK